MSFQDLPRVLLVEDDLRLSELVRSYLQSNGFDVLVEYRGDGVLDRVQTDRPDVLVLDLGLPGRDGFTVCKELQIRQPCADPHPHGAQQRYRSRAGVGARRG